MLSRVAERIYWSARYLERVENTARLVGVYDNLLFDLPRDTNISWFNLIRINSCTDTFSERYKVQTEHNVVKFLLADDTNPSSMLSSLKHAKENIRTTRDVLPQDTWEQINELDLYARNNIRQGINRTDRHKFLNNIIQRCQEINGLFEGAMSRDASWQFMTLGRNLERADMTTRILDAGVSIMLQPNQGTRINLSQVVWGNVLRSLSGYMNYRRSVRTAIESKKVARFLLEDEYFPRTINFCINEMETAAKKLPRSKNILKDMSEFKKLHYSLANGNPLDEKFRDYLNQLQISISELHTALMTNWFAFNMGDPQEEIVTPKKLVQKEYQFACQA
ncbi:alpha-E domain-containing protein [Neptuniibacter sp. 1_MG-2023]|uniref:alpha-E domain-containing protein n=1 Tax=Neptuniibacter sp. 1_MG-2023 TaxID=3062662 RepID=UPI0026E1C2CC|nr:alpha-E domain-containing protein [Neptuniibacter sp. 1_MG-2023]MDO6593668.1 alpha-E domain-containing protein [Neptuniibacter sp. 1_MG-2023]